MSGFHDIFSIPPKRYVVSRRYKMIRIVRRGYTRGSELLTKAFHFLTKGVCYIHLKTNVKLLHIATHNTRPKKSTKVVTTCLLHDWLFLCTFRYIFIMKRCDLFKKEISNCGKHWIYQLGLVFILCEIFSAIIYKNGGYTLASSWHGHLFCNITGVSSFCPNIFPSFSSP